MEEMTGLVILSSDICEMHATRVAGCKGALGGSELQKQISGPSSDGGISEPGLAHGHCGKRTKRNKQSVLWSTKL